jgi:tetratricopeptide (TPR) repeat protein
MDPSAIQAAAERAAASRSLRPSAHLVRLLRFLVNETLAGRGGRLKEYVLGTEVFDRGPDFDPQIDTIVRVQVRRLRSKLTEYYANEGAHDSIRIQLNPGSYAPIFEPVCRETDAPGADATRVDRARTVMAPRWLPALAAVVIVGLASWAIVAWRHAAAPPAAPAAVAVNRDAHALYLQAKAAYATGSREALSTSEALFEQALAVDPRYAPAHAGLAYTYLMESSNFAAPADVMPKARDAANRALAVDASIVEAQTALGTVALFYDWNARAADAAISRALSVDPRSSSAHELRAERLMADGRFDAALVEIQVAQQADPLSAALEYDAGWILIAARRYGESAAASRRALARDPNFALARGILGLALVLDGHDHDGIAELETASAQGESAILDLMLVHGYAWTHRIEAARTILTRVEASASHRYVCDYEVASAYAALGDLDRAFEWFHRALAQRSDCVVWLRVEPWLDELRSDERFGPLLRDVTAAGR